MNRFLLAHVTSLPKTRRCHEPLWRPGPIESGWLAVLAAAALLWGCASPTSDGGGTGGSHVGGSSGATGSGGRATGGSSAGGSGGSTGVPPTGAGGSASTGGGGGSGAGGPTASGGSTGAGGSGGPGGSGVAGTSGKGGQSGTGGTTGTGGAGSGGNTGTGGSSNACTPGAPWTGGQQYSSNGVNNVGNGYSYQLYFAGDPDP